MEEKKEVEQQNNKSNIVPVIVFAVGLICLVVGGYCIYYNNFHKEMVKIDFETQPKKEDVRTGTKYYNNNYPEYTYTYTRTDNTPGYTQPQPTELGVKDVYTFVNKNTNNLPLVFDTTKCSHYNKTKVDQELKECVKIVDPKTLKNIDYEPVYNLNDFKYGINDLTIKFKRNGVEQTEKVPISYRIDNSKDIDDTSFIHKGTRYWDYNIYPRAANKELRVGDKTKITYEISPKVDSNPKIGFYSKNENVATVDGNGNVTTVGVGQVTICTTYENKGVFENKEVSANCTTIDVSISCKDTFIIKSGKDYWWMYARNDRDFCAGKYKIYVTKVKDPKKNYYLFLKSNERYNRIDHNYYYDYKYISINKSNSELNDEGVEVELKNGVDLIFPQDVQEIKLVKVK